MPKKNHDTTKELKNLLGNILPADVAYTLAVEKEQQIKQLHALEASSSDEDFYFVFNLLSFELEFVKNVSKLLGYADNTFTVGKYLNCIHKSQAIQFNMIAHNMYKILCSGAFKLHFGAQKYISLVALKHYNGEYITFKKTTSIFQYDTGNRLIAQLNEFSRIDVYEGEPMKPRVTENNGFQKADFERIVFEMVLKNFMEQKYFSEKEFLILKHYASNELLNRKQLAALLGITVSTVDTFSKRILAKARDTFTHTFHDVRAVALYLKKERIL